MLRLDPICHIEKLRAPCLSRFRSTHRLPPGLLVTAAQIALPSPGQSLKSDTLKLAASGRPLPHLNKCLPASGRLAPAHRSHHRPRSRFAGLSEPSTRALNASSEFLRSWLAPDAGRLSRTRAVRRPNPAPSAPKKCRANPPLTERFRGTESEPTRSYAALRTEVIVSPTAGWRGVVRLRHVRPARPIAYH